MCASKIILQHLGFDIEKIGNNPNETPMYAIVHPNQVAALHRSYGDDKRIWIDALDKWSKLTIDKRKDYLS